MKNKIGRARLIAAVVLALTVPGCVLEPRGAKDERARVRDAGDVYAQPFDARSVPELPASPSTIDVLRRGLLTSGEVEVAYFEWAAAAARIQQAGAYPNSPLSVGFQQSFDGGRIKSFDQTSITAGPDAAENLKFPSKVSKAADLAYEATRSSGRRFVATKLDVQKRIFSAWFDYALAAEQLRLLDQQVGLLQMAKDTSASRVQAGGGQADLLKADVALRLAIDERATRQSKLVQQRAALNAILARPADATLEAPATIPEPRQFKIDDATLLVAAARNDPGLQALAYSVVGRSDALQLAKLQYIPDFNPTFGLAGGSMQAIGLGVTLPTVLPRIEGMIDEARADLRAAEATLRQQRQNRAAALVAALASMRNSERQAALFSTDVLPLAQRVVESTRRSYSAGNASYLDLIDAERTLLGVRETYAEARVAREKSLAEIEALAGFDVETLNPSATQPTTRATTQELP